MKYLFRNVDTGKNPRIAVLWAAMADAIYCKIDFV